MSRDAPGPRAEISTTSAGRQQWFLDALEARGRLRRDSELGRILHPGTASYRESVPENSVHIVVRKGRLFAHLDAVSPVRFTKDGEPRYSFWRIGVHNVKGIFEALLEVLHAVGRKRRGALRSDSIEVDGPTLLGWMRQRPDGTDPADAAFDRLRRELLPRDERVHFNLADEVVHALDCSTEPWTLQVEVRVPGRLDEHRLRRALHEALDRHPMARARKSSEPAWNRNFWEYPPALDVDPLQVVDDADDAAVAATRAQLYSRPLPVACSPPLRVRLVRRRDGDLLMLTLDHTAIDGIGGVRLLRSIARAYTGVADPQPGVDFLGARDLMGGHAAVDARMRVHRYLALPQRCGELIDPPARLARLHGRAGPGYGFHHVRLDVAETRHLTDVAHPASVTDVLVAALHRAIAAWNARHDRPCRRISVAVPANLRRGAQCDELVGNFCFPARVSTTSRQRVSPAATLAAVTAQTGRKQRSGLGTPLLELVSWSYLLPLRVKRGLYRAVDRRLSDTAVLSDLGAVDTLSFGDEAGRAVELWFSPPARMPEGVAIGASTVDGRLHLVFRYRHRQFGAQAAGQFAACYLTELRRLMGQPTDRPGGGTDVPSAGSSDRARV